jgi:hypothetical protein
MNLRHWAREVPDEERQRWAIWLWEWRIPRQRRLLLKKVNKDKEDKCDPICKDYAHLCPVTITRVQLVN